MRVVPYHIDSSRWQEMIGFDHLGERIRRTISARGRVVFSLSNVYSSEAEAQEQSVKQGPLSIIREYDLEEQVYILYTANIVPPGTLGRCDPNCTGSERQLLELIVRQFGEIDQRQQPTWYKPLDTELIERAIQRIEWRQTLKETGGDLISELICRHGLPNTNHRTAIAVLLDYIVSFGNEFIPPETGDEDGWAPWANNYICESKQCLTVRRNYRTFTTLMELGAIGVVRKHGIDIFFDEYDPTVEQAAFYYDEQHRAASREFVENVLKHGGVPGWVKKKDRGLRVLASRL